jgi:nucleotide-binding universal stress UspA family protein
MAYMVETNSPATAGPGRVVVGVNGALAGCRQALVFAAHEARLRNATIRLVHGCEPLATLTERQPAVPLVARERQARRQLRDAADALRPLLDPEATVEFRIDPRTGVDALLDESATAELIVLQRRELAALGRATAGSTSSAVAARARCPVAVTRAGLRSAHQRGGVLVGVDGQVGAEAAVRMAFMRAAGRRARLTAIQVLTQGEGGWGLPSWAYDISAAAHERARSALAELIDHYAGSFPDVVVAQIVVAGEAVDALREATASAELLVIGRYSGKQREARSLGSVARQLINTARCPTLVAPPIQAGTDTGPSRVTSISDARPQSSPSSAR